MAKALTSWVIRRLERSLIELSDSSGEKIEKVINEMRIILDFLGDKKLGKGNRLNYFIADIADMVREALNVEDDLGIYAKLCHLETWVGEVKTRMLKYSVDGAETSLEGDDADDDDEEGDAVGLEKDVKLLLHRGVFSKEQKLQTATITGMVGIGKTTLARQVYGHADIKDRFNRRVWVSGASELSHKEVLMKLIRQVVECEELERDSLLKKMEYADNRSLRQMLHQRLQGMRYFIVLDDWPEEMCLRSILKGLPHEDKGSRLLLTKGTYYIDEWNHYDHEMKCLDYDSSWQLFFKTIFSGTSEHIFPKKLEKKAKEMLTKCGGLPLAIKEVGKQLAKKRCSGTEWEEILQQPIDWSAILEILELSYDKLDPELKPSFLHLPFFKENSILGAEKLMLKARILKHGVDEDRDVVGLEKDVKRLLHIGVFNQWRQLRVATITGMVGVGKTTLARQVYNHADVIDRFDRRAWVRVSSELSHKEVLMKLIQQVVDCEELERDSLLKKLKYANNQSLKQMLRQHLQGMRYFIVLDDWPNEMNLGSIMEGLPHEDKKKGFIGRSRRAKTKRKKKKNHGNFLPHI